MNRLLGALTCVVALLAAFPVARAETPDSTLVMAMNIDDIISLDPAETFELVGGEVIANVYDRITVYEPGAVVELTGGVAESWDVADDGHTIILHVRPDQTFHSGNPVTAADVVFSLTRVIKLNKTPSFIFSQFGWTPENVDQMVSATDDMTVELKIPESLAPTLVLNCLAAGVGSVVDHKVALEHESNGDLGYEWLKTNSAGSGPFTLRSWKPNESVILEAYADSRFGAPAMERVILRHVPEPGAQRLLIEKGDADIARNLTADQIAGLEGNDDIVIQTDPKATMIYLQVSMRDPVLSKPKVREALRYRDRLPGHGRFVPARAVQGAPVVLAVGLLRLADRQRRSRSTLPRPRLCWPRPATRTASRSRWMRSTPRPMPTSRRRCRRPWERPASTSRSNRRRPRRSTPSTGRAISR